MASRLGFEGGGTEKKMKIDMGLKARMWAARLGFGPRSRNMGFETGIWALRLEFWPLNWDLRGGTKKEKEEKILHMSESISKISREDTPPY